MKIGGDGTLNLVGYLQGTADLDPGTGEAIRTSSGVQDSFILRLDSNYQLIDEVQIARASGDITGLDVDKYGNVIVAGSFGVGGPVKLPTGDVFDGSNGVGYGYLLKLNTAAGVTVGPSVGLVTSEDGTSTSFNVVLDIPPTANVTIPVSSSNPGEGVVSTGSLTFTPANWNVPQIVTITGVNDSAIDGAVVYSIVLGPATSADSAYDGLNANVLSVTNTDNDAPLVLFTDSFEVGEWNGLWVEDSQNDWYRSNQRATSGSWAAEVDGSATNATLAITSPIDLTGMQTSTLTFDWLIESGFDSGEYLSLDISTNGGSSWIQDVRRLNGDVDSEDVWHHETVDLTAYSSANLKIRFRSKVSASDEDANVDNVRITAIPAGPNTPPVAAAGGPYAMNEGSSVTLTASGSTDSDGTISSYAWDFDGDGQYNDASGMTVNFTTIQSGSRVIGLRVTDNRGATATTTTSVGVGNVAPTANAGADQNAFKEAIVNLSAASSTDPGNDIIGYAWDLNGDGQYTDASGVNATFSSSFTGSFTVSVRVTDADGAVSFDSATITVLDASTKFYVVDDATTNRTYEYAADGSSIENYAINNGNSAPRGAASTAAGTTVWVADKNRKVYVYDTAGANQGSWTAGTLATNAQVEGLATNGTDVWIVDNRSDKVYRYTNAAGRLSGSQTAVSSFSLNTSNANPKGIVTDGTYLWIVNDSTSDKVFKYTISGSLVGSWTIDSGNQTPTGLTIDPANGSQSIWIVDSGTDRVYEYAVARSRVSGSQAAGITFALASGNSNPQGIADPPPPVKLDIAPQHSSEVEASATAIIAPPPSLALTTDRGRYLEPQAVTVSTEEKQRSALAPPPTFT
ncbi:MAG: PKD domain-containing protein, partial [Aureliella sp.]